MLPQFTHYMPLPALFADSECARHGFETMHRRAPEHACKDSVSCLF